MGRSRMQGSQRQVSRSLAFALCAASVATADAPASAQDITPFTEEAQLRGVEYFVEQGWADFGYGTGAAMVDLDHDGFADIIVVGREDGVVGLFRNDGTGHFEDHSQSSGFPLIPGSAGVSVADYNGNGFLDVYFSDWEGANVLVRNEGDLTFTDVTEEAGVGDIGIGTGTAWADINGNGWLDLYLANRTVSGNEQSEIPNRLYRNNGDGTFDEVAAEYGLDDDMPTFQPIFFDMNKNGLIDLYLSNDKGYADHIHNRLFQNVGDAFVEVTESSGTAANIDSMGVAVGDFNGNGWADLYCTNTPLGNLLFINQGDGTFTEESTVAGVKVGSIGWGTLFFDFDNSGRQDLFVCNSNARNRLFRNNGEWPCQDITTPAGFTHNSVSYIVAAADIDHDGDIDLLVQNLNQPVRLYINNEGSQRNWVKFDVVGTAPNHFAVGARVEICTEDHMQMREVHAGISYKSQNEYTLHFGVDQHNLIDEITVFWPGGDARSLAAYPANQTWTLYPEAHLGDANGDGVVDLTDFPHFNECFTGLKPGEEGAIVTGCEMMDFTGSGTVDLDDFDQFLNVYTGPLNDCNGSGQIDLLDILLGVSHDENGNGVPDECETAPGDINNDGVVNVDDLLVVLNTWGTCSNCDDCPADVTGDCIVNVDDLLIVLNNWG